MQCTKCGDDKPADQFIILKKTGKPRGWCRYCANEYSKALYRRSPKRRSDAARQCKAALARCREWVNAYLESHPCVDCGEADIDVLEFDHRDPEDKVHTIADCSKRSWSIVKLAAEVAKCDVRCANCHVKRTRRQFGWHRRKSA